MTPRPLDDFLTPIRSDLAEAEGGRLSPERAAELDERLRELDAARGDAVRSLQQ